MKLKKYETDTPLYFFLKKELTPKIHKCTFPHSITYFLMVYFNTNLISRHWFEWKVCSPHYFLGITPLGFGFSLSALDFPSALLLSQEGRVRLGERRVRGETNISVSHSHCVLLCFLERCSFC